MIIAFSEPETLCELEFLAEPTYNKAEVKLAKTLKKVPGAKEAKDMLVRALTGGAGLKKYFPENFNRRLFDCEKVESDPFLKRINNPRIVLEEKDGTVYLRITGAFDSAA